GTSCTNVDGATSPFYTLSEADVGSVVRSAVTTQNPVGSTTAESVPTQPVQPLVLPSNTSPPTVSGALTDGQGLSVTDGLWDGYPSSFVYQWKRCDVGGRCSKVVGATSPSYTLTSADVGKDMRVRVMASNAGGSAIALS